MERLTNKECADSERKVYQEGLERGYKRDYHIDLFLKLAAYEDTGLSPEDIQEAVNIVSHVFAASDIPTELKSWAERCTWHVKQCDKLRHKLDVALSEKAKLEMELDAAKRDIAAIIWLNGECKYCKHAKKISYSGAEQFQCTLENRSDCCPEWNNGCA